ncbi:MAG TPA: M3 family oligoendopeptidase [Herpetosiphonaceae bacterium]
MADLASIDPLSWQELEPHYSALLAEPLTAETAAGWLQRWSDLETLFVEAISATFRAKTEHTADAEAEQRYQHLITVIQPEIEATNQQLKQKLLSTDYLDAQPEYHELLRLLRSEAALFRAANLPLQAEEQARSSGYYTITGAQTVTLDGQELTIPQAEQRLLDPDRDRREQAWRAIAERRRQDRVALSELFLELIALRRRIAANADCADYRDYSWRRLKRFDYTPQDSQALHDAIEAEIVPLAARMAERRRRQLGVATIRPWDTRVDYAGRPPLRPFTTADELEAGVARMLAQTDPELGAQFERMRNGFLDLRSRKDKAVMGYQTFFPRLRMPYIFMNAVGTQLDIQVLLHEAGHAFHALAASAHQSLIWYIVDSPIEFRELASQAMELLAIPYYSREQGGFYSAEDARRALHEQLDLIVASLRNISANDAFQHWVYAEASPDVTPDELDARYRQLQQRFFPEEDWSGLDRERGMRWQIGPHAITLPFYMIEYVISRLGSLQVWRQALTDQTAALRQYRAALALGGSRPLPELYSTAGARMAFDRETIADLARLLETQLELDEPAT